MNHDVVMMAAIIAAAIVFSKPWGKTTIKIRSGEKQFDMTSEVQKASRKDGDKAA